ncbi:MAG TPA: FtsX-like permease family protein [Solirubrobacteraceae bacterium]|nr:FtsX-like permease family protein [Solirubrobacteraceae bacterium]
MLRLTLKGLAARPLRTALTTLAIVLGVALVSGALTLTDTQRKGADALSSASYDGTDAVVSARTAFAVDSSEDWTIQKPAIAASALEKVRAVPEVGVAVGDVTDQNAKIIGKDGEPVGDGPYFGVGYDARAEGADRVSPFRLVDGRWATGPGQVVVDEKTAEDEGYRIGDRVPIATLDGTQRFELVGVSNFGEVESLGVATTAVFDLATAQDLFDKGNAFDSILVAGREGGPSGAQVRQAVAQAVPEAQVEAAAKHDRFTFDGLEGFISIIRTVLLAFGGVAILVGALTILNSLSITVAQRTRELGLVRLIGASRRQVLTAVVAEAFTIGLLGSLAGLAAGYGLAALLQSFFASIGLDLPQAGTVFSTGTVAASMIVGTVVTTLAGIVPALRATRIAPVTALRDASEGSRRTGLAGRAVRPFLSLLGRPSERLGGVAGRLARRNALRQPGRTAATAGALTVGIALVTVVAVLAAGLRDTTEGAAERRLAATHVVTAQDDWSPTDPAIVDAVEAAPGVRAVTTIKQDGARAFGDTERINGLDASTADELFAFDYADGATTTVAALGADGAIVDEGLADEHGLDVGDRFEITAASGRKLDLVVRGIETSPVLDAFDLGPISIGSAAYASAFENERNVYTFVDAESTAAVERALAPHPDAKAVDKAQFVENRMQAIDMLMAIFAVLLALAITVSLFGIVNALVLATFERRRELGMLAAVGMTRRQIRRMVRHESVVTALMGVSSGIAAGLALGYGVTSLLGDQGLTFAVPGGTIAALAVAGVVIGVLAAVLPARRAARLSPLNALAYE